VSVIHVSMEVLVQTKSMVIRVHVQLDGRVQTVIRVNLIITTFVNISSSFIIFTLYRITVS